MITVPTYNKLYMRVKHILNIDLLVENDNINVNLITDGLFNYSCLNDQSKVIIKPTEMAKYLNRNCVFQIDGNKIDLYNIVTKKDKQL